ncbi:MAG: riboflavin biosynthesis protein RibF [Planctomycetes bacterium]|nr:riboflavin biosynthesis protein RibF [Planctomycetota bacterium]
MELLRNLDALPDPRLRGCAVTWGVFDGVHLGHRKVLARLLEIAGDAPSVVVTFDRHPAEILHGKPVPLLVPVEERLRLIAACGVGFAVMIPFTREFAQTTAEGFVRDVAVGRIGARAILLGHDSHFGRDRRGDFELLARVGTECGVRVEACGPEVFQGRPVSSTAIRRAVAEGRLEDAAAMLGRPVSCRGVVVRGDRRGAALGFPTANLDLAPGVRPLRGVYAVETSVDGRAFAGVANLGCRPTFHGEGAPEVLEVHLLDYAGGDLYGRTLEVRFLYRVREERNFRGPEEVRRQIEADVAAVRERMRR